MSDTTPGGKIAVEEHMIPPELVGHVGLPFTGPILDRLTDTGAQRLALMDTLGVETAVLSLAGPGVQGDPDVRSAVEFASTANDLLAGIVRRHPDRFAGLAALPMQDPSAAVAELDRATQELGLVGVLVNGYSCVGDVDTAVYADDPSYRPFWGRVAELGVPFYLHPRNPPPSQCRIYEGHPELLGASWAFAAETAVHALRLMTSGLFDELPTLTIVLGHLGELLPFAIHRAAARMDTSRLPIEKSVADYFRSNFVITTSGNFHQASLLGAASELGSDRILFALDYPFADVEAGSAWFDDLGLSPDDRLRIGRSNAEDIFGLNRNAADSASNPSPRWLAKDSS